jgi:acetyltransferase-like isoleucine patch superfamily enzyme
LKKLIKKAICIARGIKSGSNSFVSFRAELVNPGRISVGNNVVIEGHARLIANGGKGAEIIIGDDTYIQPYAVLKANGGKIMLGKNCTVNDYAVLYGHGGLTIGNDVHISTHAVFVPANHVFKDPSTPISKQGETKNGITVGDDVWIGANSSILDGVNIGKGCVIGAGAVVTGPVPPFSVAAGVPARVIKQRGE